MKLVHFEYRHLCVHQDGYWYPSSSEVVLNLACIRKLTIKPYHETRMILGEERTLTGVEILIYYENGPTDLYHLTEESAQAFKRATASTQPYEHLGALETPHYALYRTKQR